VAPYLTHEDIVARLLARFQLEAEIAPADADIASFELDSSGPFIGAKLDEAQPHQFPRDEAPDGTPSTSEDIPDAVLDWVSLRAYQLSSDEAPAVKQESAGRVSVTYADPKLSQSQNRMERLLVPYLSTLDVGGSWTLGVASSLSRYADEFGQVPDES
jgi:hypothetical protein